MNTPFDDPDIKAAFDAFPAKSRGILLSARNLIFETAGNLDACGSVVEALKWGQPAYLTEKPKSGSTIRLGTMKANPDRPMLFFHCQSGLVSEFRQLYSDVLHFEGERAILLDVDAPLPAEPLRHCIALALTHHTRKKRKTR